MGTWSRNFLIPKANPATAREIFVNWMERKGFDQMERPPLFECAKDEERCAFLFSNKEWTVLIYNEAFQEGDRILTEFDDYPALIEVWIGDSDHWGYALYEKGEFSAGCTLNQDYEAKNSQPPASPTDAEKICKILGFESRLAQVKKTQRKRHLFADVPCENFCQTIGALPAMFTAKDVESWNAGRLESREIAEWKIEPLLFERRKPFGQEADQPILHTLATRSFSPREPRPQFDQTLRNLQRNTQILVWIFRPIGWLLAAPFLASIWLDKLGIKKSAKPKPGQEILRAIHTVVAPWRWDGSWLVNDRHGCRIRAPKSSEGEKVPIFIYGVFRFFVDEVEISCVAVRPASLRRIFDLCPDQTVLKDETFFVREQSTRILSIQTQQKDGTNYHYFWFIELPGVIYQFTLFRKSELPESTFAKITDVVKTFETFSKIDR